MTLQHLSVDPEYLATFTTLLMTIKSGRRFNWWAKDRTMVRFFYPGLAIWQCSWIQWSTYAGMYVFRLSDSFFPTNLVVLPQLWPMFKRNLNYQTRKLAKNREIFVDIRTHQKTRGHILARKNRIVFPTLWSGHEVSPHSATDSIYFIVLGSDMYA